MAAVSSAPRVSAPSTGRSSHPYTCNTCQVAFKGSDLQRGHMQSDWHRYNLKRRVASLPPLTSEIFAEKVLASQASAAATAARASFEKICTACQRTYFSENAYENHLKSQKHKQKLALLSNGQHETETETETASMASSTFSLGEPVAYVQPSPKADVDDPVAEAEFAKVVDGIKDASLEEDGDPVGRRPSRPHHSADPTAGASIAASSSSATPAASVAPVDVDPTLACLFCNNVSSDIDHNVAHMSKSHGLFIPEQAYLIDLPGLLEYLHERVQVLHECLYCGQKKHTTTGIQTHMRDKGHCMIAFESEEEMVEVGQFYDFRSTYSDEDMEDESDEEDDTPATKEGGVKLGAERQATYTVAEGNENEGADDDEDGWESDDSDMTEGEEGRVSTSARDRSYRSTRSANQAYELDHELHLPSGRTAGHRTFARYFRQNLHNYPTAAERLQQQQQRLTESGEVNAQGTDADATRGRRQLAVSRADGGLGMLSAPAEKKKEARTIEMKERKRAQREQTRYQWGNERRANFQKHFRDPLLQ